MRTRLASLTTLACILATPALAQNSTAAAGGVGVGIANSTSQSGAVAVSGSGGQGGNSTVNIGGAPSQQTIDTRASGDVTSRVIQSGTVTSRIEQSGTTTQNINQSGSTTNRIVSSGTTTVRSAPPIAAPGLAAAGLETCLGSASGGVSAVGFGITGGASIVDEGCQARLDSRTLFFYGLKSAAVARLCQRADIWRSMPDVCAQYWPVGQPYPAGIAVAVQPAGYGLPVRALMSASGGSVESVRVVNGKTGIEGDCLNYSYTKQKCYQWAGEPTVAPRRQHAAVKPNIRVEQRPERIKPKPTGTVITSPEQPKAEDEKKS